jgi:hypothetical protein
MAHVNNIYGIKINSIANNGSVNFGNVIHKGHQANVKANVGYAQAGDNVTSPINFVNRNAAVDPDAVDNPQSQV